MEDRNVLGSLRIIAGFSLLGAVVCGAFFSWVDVPGDIRNYGAGVGAMAAVILKARHVL